MSTFASTQRRAQEAAAAAIARRRTYVATAAAADHADQDYAWRAGYEGSAVEAGIRAAAGQLAYFRSQHSESIALGQTDAAFGFREGARSMAMVLRVMLPPRTRPMR